MAALACGHALLARVHTSPTCSRACGSVCVRAQSVANRFMDVADDAVIDADVGTMIKTLWKDAGILRAYENRASFQLNDSAD